MALILFLCESTCGVGFNLKQVFSELINRNVHLLPSHTSSPRRTIILERRRKEPMKMNSNNVEIATVPAFPGLAMRGWAEIVYLPVVNQGH